MIKIKKNGIDVGSYIRHYASRYVLNGGDESCIHYIARQDYIAVLAKEDNKNDKVTYRILPGSFCKYRGHTKQNKEISLENAKLIEDNLFFDKETEPYSYSSIMCIMRNDHPSSYAGATFNKLYNGDKIVFDEVDCNEGSKIDLFPWEQDDTVNCVRDIEECIVDESIVDKWNKVIGSNVESKAVIFSGPPGTGKSTIAKALVNDYIENHGGFVYNMSFTEDTSYNDFIGGIELVDGNTVFKSGILMNACVQAYKNPDKLVFMIIDEINRAKTERVFGEALAAMEARGQRFVLKSGKTLVIPKNLVIVAARNTTDKGACELGEAFSERFVNIYVNPCWNIGYVSRFTSNISEDLTNLVEIVDNINKALIIKGLDDYQVGTRVLNKMIEITDGNLDANHVKELAKQIYDILIHRLNRGSSKRYIDECNLEELKSLFSNT